MATLTIGDRRIAVDDAFHDLPPDEQQAAVAEITSQLGARPAEQAGAAAAPASVVRVGPRPAPAAAPAAAMPSVAMAQGRAPVDFGIHGGQPIAPFGFAGPIQRSSAGAPIGNRPGAARPAGPASDDNAAKIMDAFSYHGGLPSLDYGDIAKSAGIGLVNGLINTAGSIPAASDVAHRLANWLIIDPALNAVLGPPKPVAVPPPNINAMFSPPGIRKAIERVTGDFYQPKTAAGRYVETIGEFTPAAIGGGVRALGQAASGAAMRAGLLNIGNTFTRHAVAPGVVVQALEDAFPDNPAGPVIKKFYSPVRYGLPLALAAIRARRSASL